MLRFTTVTSWLIFGVLFTACQTSPINSNDNIESLTNKSMANLERLTPDEFTKPELTEKNIVRGAINSLYNEKDDRLFPLISLLKDNRISLMINDINSQLADPENKKDSEYISKLSFYKLAVQSYIDPPSAQKNFLSLTITDKSIYSAQIQDLKKAVNNRLANPENKLVSLQLQLLRAEVEHNQPLQISLHKKLLDLESAKNNQPKIIYHLNKIIELTDDNEPQKFSNYEKLITIYRKNNQEGLAKTVGNKALTLARKNKNEEMTGRFESLLGIVSLNPIISQYSERQLASLAELETLTLIDAKHQNADNLFIIASEYYHLGHSQRASNLAIRALTQARVEKNIYLEALSINLIGDVARTNGELGRARIQYSLSSEILKGQEKLNEQLITQIKLLHTTIYLNDKEAADKHLQDMMSLQKNVKSDSNNAELWKARIEIEKHLYQASQKKEFNPNAPIWKNNIAFLQIQSPSSIAEETYAHAAIILSKLGQSQLAINYYNNAATLGFDSRRFYETGRYLANMGLIYNSINKKTEARKTLRQSVSVFKSLHSPHAQTVVKLLNSVSK